MAAITPGSGGTFKTLTAEGRTLEVLVFLQTLEKNPLKNPQNRTYINGTLNTRSGLYGGTFSLPVTESLFTDGSLRLQAKTYLEDSEVVPGSGSPTFKSATAEEYTLEVLSHLQMLERTPARNPQARNAITSSYNQDTGIMQGTFSLPCEISVDPVNGLPTFSAQPYLTA